MGRWLVRTTEEERAFEEKRILGLMDQYLATDVMEKVAKDDGYRTKVEMLERELGPCDGYVLDIGSNTAGECEYLVTRGYGVIATDINHHALAVSRERCARFGRPSPDYIACDASMLPFATASMQCVVFNESLHHMLDPLACLREAHRVLVSGGRVLMFEPYAYDPWRRISEVRDYFRGSIETSFSEGEIKRLLRGSGLDLLKMARPVMPPSQYKLAKLPSYRRALRNGYFRVRKTLPSMLGMILCQGRKPGSAAPPNKRPNLESLLVCPVSRTPLAKSKDGSEFRSSAAAYPIRDGIPMLLEHEMRQVRTGRTS